jgi:hypothetical protein
MSSSDDKLGGPGPFASRHAKKPKAEAKKESDEMPLMTWLLSIATITLHRLLMVMLVTKQLHVKVMNFRYSPYCSAKIHLTVVVSLYFIIWFCSLNQ